MIRSAIQTVAAIRAGQTSAVAEAEAAIARVEAGDGAINAVVVRDFDRALTAAVEADRRIAAGDTAPLLGLPMTVKESFDVAGLPTGWGFAEHSGHIARQDAVTVQRLKAAGAVILGKTNVPVALGDWQSVNPVYGRTRNPHDLERSPGGSSGGAAAALAAGFVAAELGSDIGGSIRVPAAFCGVWGHKPTYGVVPMAGHFFPGTDAASEPLGVAGPLARDADDLALLLDVLTDLPLPKSGGAPNDWRILVLPEHPLARASAEVKAAVTRAGEALAAAGARVTEASGVLPNLVQQHGDYMRMLVTVLARGAPSPSGQFSTLPYWFELADAQFRCVEAWRRLFLNHDALIVPVAGATAFPHDVGPLTERLLDMDGADEPFAAQFAYAGIASFPNLPATSAPIAIGAGGLPIGLQVICDRYQDHKAIAIARALHALMRN